jgi:haloalkane dehalogenase
MEQPRDLPSGDAPEYQEVWVSRSGGIQRGAHRIYARDYRGEGGPAIVLLHGFPDNIHLYDRLVPHLTPPRRVVTFDFLGWGSSDKPQRYRYTATNQTGDLDAVISQLGAEQVVLVAHDASGPPAIDWALANPERVAALVLLNTYYAFTRSLKRPPAIALYSTPVLRNLARLVVSRWGSLDETLYRWQVGRFIEDPALREEFVPLLYSGFRAARPAFWSLNNDLLPTVLSRRKMIPRMRAFDRPVRIIFGARDPYLNPGVARRFHQLFPSSDLFLLPDARHYLQVDQPEQVADLILSMPTAS